MVKTLTVQIKAKTAAVLSALKQLGDAVAKAFVFEKARIQFKHILGDINLAKQRVAELREMGMSGAFNFEDLAKASISLERLTGGALTGAKYFNLIQDAAAATGKPVEQVALAVGKFYNALKQGDDIGRAVKQLREMGVVTGDAAAQLVQMNGDGEEAINVFQRLITEMEAFKGANDEIANSAAGRFDELSNRIDDIQAKMGEQFAKRIAPTKKELNELVGILKTFGIILANIASAIVIVGKGIVAGIGGAAKLAKEQIKDFYNSRPVQAFLKTPLHIMMARSPAGLAVRGIAAAGKGVHDLNWGELTKSTEDEDKAKIAEDMAQAQREKDKKERAERNSMARKEADRRVKIFLEAEKKRYAQQKSLDDKATRNAEANLEKQIAKVKKLKDSIIQAKGAIESAFGNSFTTTGAIGGYQSGAEQARAEAVLTVQKNQLEALQKQNDKLEEIKDQLIMLYEKENAALFG